MYFVILWLEYLVRHGLSLLRQVWLFLGFLCHNKAFLFRDRVDQGKEKVCRDTVGQCMENFVATEYFYVATELVKAIRNYVATNTICVAIENSAAHDKVGHA